MSETIETPVFVLTLSCPDQPGIVHAVSGVLAGVGGNIVASQQFGSPTGTFFMRVEFAALSPVTEVELTEALAGVAAEFSMDYAFRAAKVPTRTLIMVSKDGHALNDLLYARHAGNLNIDVPVIVSNHTALADMAAFYEVPFVHIPVTPETKQEAEAQLLDLIADHDIELVVLARYMQILSDELCRELEGRAINIHHSFLPAFKGAKPYHQAHARGVKLIGATAHYVTADLDEGPIIEQEVIRVNHARSPEQFVALGRDVEGRTLTQAVQWHSEQRVLLDGNRTVIFN
ncbi:formyltetrahydrofolate deformylase [Haematomicrobium sanguinis]|uniref:formyltetrahydrofolate deformylase n=1 Tax=Haematomicrobium sanguinis TaxID=479106 RepID=UPI0004796ACC|nr:formyltetrahydrofolate deformylase [Haematomicrobium sanguinis]